MAWIYDYIWLVPALPLLGSIINVFMGPILGARAARPAGILASALMGLSFVVALLAFIQVSGNPPTDAHSAVTGIDYVLYTWIGSGDFQVPIAFYIDQLSTGMMMLVTGVGFLIHVYSIGYMHGDIDPATVKNNDPATAKNNEARFFTYLNLFAFSMLMLVMANNYLLMFLGWEGVGVCSYLLIGFWYAGQDPHHQPDRSKWTGKAQSDAAKKAFIVNRVGDVGFALGIMLLFTNFGSLAFRDIFPVAGKDFVLGNVTIACLLLFAGAIGKSAQFPLHVWLPDAMEGPTPVSALIHAATMVTAGVYLVARSNPLFHADPTGTALNVVMIIGTVTALLGATIALVQPDIKRVVAYSTVSQLGYMFAGLGVGAYGAAIFHLLMHGVFKALLFLGSGSVIHGMHGEQDINRMGQLLRKMPVTAITFIIGALSNAGFWFFTGFWSKDAIIAMAAKAQPIIGGLLIFGSFLTAFYMFRLVFLVFWGPNHVDPHIHPHESGPVMIWPLIILAVPAAILGAIIGLPPEHGLIDQFLHPTFQTAVAEEGGHVPTLTEFLTFQTPDWGLLIIGGLVATIGIFFAWMLYYRESDIPRAVSEFPGLRAVYQALLNRWYFDDLYDLVFRRGGVWLTNLSWAFDRSVVDGLVNGVAGFLNRSGGRLRRTTTGFVGNYALSIALGVLALITYLFFASDVFGNLRRWLGF